MSQKQSTNNDVNRRKKAYSGTRKGLILDPIHPHDWRELKITYCCEQCSHFDSKTMSCTIGYDASKHLRQVQDQSYYLQGRVAFCRFSELD